MKVFYSPIWRYGLIESNIDAGLKMLQDLKADDYSGPNVVVVIDWHTLDILFTGNWTDADKFYRTEIKRRLDATTLA